MGLDMYVYKVTKPTDLDTDKVYDVDKMDDVYMVFDPKEITEPKNCQLLPYTVEVQMIMHYYDADKIGREFDLHDPRLSCVHNNVISFYSREDKRTVDISFDDINDKYTKDVTERVYVCRAEGVKYWRKDYDVQSWFHEHIVDVEDVGFYHLTDKMIKEYNKAYRRNKLTLVNEDNAALFYHEWY